MFAVIVNPVSGGGEAVRLAIRISERIAAMGQESRLFETSGDGDAARQTRAAVEAGCEAVVCIGGDGTICEAAGELCHRDATFYVVPGGTGNDFARGIGLPEDDEGLVNVLTGGKSRLIDAGMAGDGFFINVAGFGFDVDVVRYTEKYKRRLNGMLPYMLGILQSLIYLSRTEAEIVTDSGETFNVTVALLSACNGTRFAGGINLAPLADYSDGLMDICILKKISRLRFLYLLPKYMKGKHLKYKNEFLYFKAKSVKVKTLTHSLMECDGEIKGETPAEFRVLSGAIDFMIGE